MIDEQLAASNAYDATLPESERINMTREQALEEVVCDAAQRMLMDTNAGRKLAEWGAESKKNGEALKSFRSWLTETMNRLRKAFKNVAPDGSSGKAFAKLDKNAKKILADMLVDMSTDTAEKLSTIKAAGMLKKLNTTNEGGVRYKNGEYWHPDMTRAEIADVRSIAKSEVFKTNNYLGIDAKWLYNNQKGNEYFALYSSIDSENPTILYACKESKAKIHYTHLTTILQRRENIRGSINTDAGVAGRLLDDIGSITSGNYQHPGSAVGTGSNNGNASVHSRNKRIRLDKAFINCLRNIEKIQQRYELGDWYQFAVDIGNYKKAKQISDDAAKAAGYEHRVFHGTSAKFNSFNTDVIYVSANKEHAKEYGSNVLDLYMKSDNPYITEDGVIRDDNGEPFILDGEEVTVGWLDAAPDVLDYLISKGYDAAWDKDMEYAAIFNAGNLKSADPVTYDDDGNVIPLSERFNPKEKDIRRKLPIDSLSPEKIKQQNESMSEEIARLRELVRLQ